MIEGYSTSGACFVICIVMSQEARGLVYFLEYVHSMVCGGKYWCGIDWGKDDRKKDRSLIKNEENVTLRWGEN